MAKKTTVTLSLDTEADKDILRWLDRQENRSSAIRTAIREHLGKGGVTLGDVYAKLCGLERQIKAGAVVAGSAPTEDDEWDEPPDAAAALNALGEL